MWLLIAEMVLALGLIVFIFWWTMRARVDKPLPSSRAQSSNPVQTLEDTKPNDESGS